MDDGIQAFIFGISKSRATIHAWGVLAVIAGQGGMEYREVRMLK